MNEPLSNEAVWPQLELRFRRALYIEVEHQLEELRLNLRIKASEEARRLFGDDEQPN